MLARGVARERSGYAKHLTMHHGQLIAHRRIEAKTTLHDKCEGYAHR
jgi:hypothetical protein